MYNLEGSMLPEDEAFALIKQAGAEPWQYALAKKLAQARRLARVTAAGVNLVTSPWGQASIIQPQTLPPNAADERF